MATRLAQWRDLGFAAIREAWLTRAAGIGDMIRVGRDSGEIEGRFEGVDAQGRLVLAVGSETLRIDAGDVFARHVNAPFGAGGARLSRRWPLLANETTTAAAGATVGRRASD
ncbi:MAG: hypothetical protein HZY79_10370 [Rhodoblastus sp.]|nr:MAG: hypothetical protein HZY79_10370 [Rhodoblastus sp.]